MLAASLFAVATAAAASAPPLPPSTKWVLDYANTACLLQRDFGAGDAMVGFGVKPSPLGDTYEFLIVNRDTGSHNGRAGTGRIWLSSQAEPVEGNYVSGRVSKDGKRLTSLLIEREELAALGAATTLRIDAGKYATVALAPDHMAEALKALDACQADLAKDFGIAPAALAAIATHAKPITPLAKWISAADYPSAALRAGPEGTSSILWTIGLDGDVADCRVLESSGSAELDGAACEAISRRGHYRPALDKRGKPTLDWSSRRINWSIPDN